MLQQNFEIDSSFLYILIECQNEFKINNVIIKTLREYTENLVPKYFWFFI